MCLILYVDPVIFTTSVELKQIPIQHMSATDEFLVNFFVPQRGNRMAISAVQFHKHSSS